MISSTLYKVDSVLGDDGFIQIENESPIDMSHLLPGQSRVCVPSKLVRKFSRLKNEELELFKLIDQDEKTAFELCYIIASNLSDTIVRSVQQKSNKNIVNGWKRLPSKVLQEQVSVNKTSRYKLILELMQKLGVIEMNHNWAVGNRCMSYRFAEEYFSTKMINLSLKETKSLKLRKKNWMSNVQRMISDDVERDILRKLSVCHKITVNDMFEIGKRKAKEGYSTKKGKKLTFLGKNMKSAYKDFDDKRIAVEDSIAVYKYIVDTNLDCLVSPVFNLLPSWIIEEINLLQ